MEQENDTSENVQYVVEIGNSNVLNLNNFAQYTLISPSGELNIGNDSDVNNTGLVWADDLNSEQTISDQLNELENALSSSSELPIIKSVSFASKRTPVSCQGQGDGADSPIFATFENLEPKVEPDENPGTSVERTPETKSSQGDADQIVYATLETSQSCVNYNTPRSDCYNASLMQPVASSGNPRMVMYHPRTLYSKDGMPYPVRGPYPSPRPRGQKRQSLPWYKTPYIVRTDMMNSSSTASDGPDFSFASSSSSTSLESSNSSYGSDTPVCPKPPNNTPNSEDSGDSPGACMNMSMMAGVGSRMLPPSQLASKLERLSQFSSADLRESHNAKERKRRSRIRDACQAMRHLIPTVNDRTDNATVFEHLAQYIHFIKLKTSNELDMEYLHQCQMYYENR